MTTARKIRHLFGLAAKQKLRVFETVMTFSQRGIYKRIDENRELLELIQERAPLFLDDHPWVEGWLHSQDQFLSDLLVITPVTKPVRNDSYPRPWPEKGEMNKAEQLADAFQNMLDKS